MKSKYFLFLTLLLMLFSSPLKANEDIDYYTDITREICKEHGRIVHIYKKDTLTLIEYKDGYLYIVNVLGSTNADVQNNSNNTPSQTPNQTQTTESSGKSKAETANYLALGYKPKTELRRQEAENTIVITPKGEKYHYLNCRTIEDLCKIVTVDEAKKLGKTACEVCKTPK